MPYDSQGNFTRLYSWEEDRKNHIDIVSDRHDDEDDNFAEALNQVMLKDGRAVMEGPMNAGFYPIKNLADAKENNDAVNKNQLDILKRELLKIFNDSVHIGDVKSSALQKDHGIWLLCDGRLLSRTEYADLFKAIGTQFGEGDKQTTFALPDCRGVVVRGCDNGRGFDPKRTLGSYQADQANNIKSVTKVIGSFNGGEISDNGTPVSVSTGVTGSNTVIGIQMVKRNVETRMKNIALNFFIKAKEE